MIIDRETPSADAKRNAVVQYLKSIINYAVLIH